jgi:hypothetical protein
MYVCGSAPEHGCQMVHTYLCIPELPILEVAGMETFAILHFGIFMAIWYFYANVVFLWQFGSFMAIWYILYTYMYLYILYLFPFLYDVS